MPDEQLDEPGSAGPADLSPTDPETGGFDRRGFLRGAALATAVAGAGAAACASKPNPSAGGYHAANSSAGASAASTPNTPSAASGETDARGWAAHDASGSLSPITFKRRAVRPDDVRIDVKYTGVCHSDVHFGHADWGTPPYPLVPGHEIAGVVVEVGSAVARFRPGDQVAVGTVVDSCGHCAECVGGNEVYCLNGYTHTYGAKSQDPGGYTQGGYSNSIVVREHYVLKAPQGLDLAQLAPMACSGVTVYSPMRAWGVREGWRVGVVGIGGLGHFAVQVAKKLGAEVVAFTTSPDKAADAERFGAGAVVVNEDKTQMDGMRRSFDFILDTVPYAHNLEPYFPLMKRQRVFCRVGLGKLATPNEWGQMSIFGNQVVIAASNTGGIRETQEAIDFCAANKIGPQTQVIAADQIGDIWKKVVDKQARYRYVVDAATIKG
ncbi:MAG: NAD(P)-dependent alcohol dehydrogenase [Segniliparus sp.]|uniref:NAD(P)-dependent alcohol dehydrogenase n=1 Tax=Segniliparus sp. TaxID=2804064 RepID=UPI003F2C6D41